MGPRSVRLSRRIMIQIRHSIQRSRILLVGLGGLSVDIMVLGWYVSSCIQFISGTRLSDYDGYLQMIPPAPLYPSRAPPESPYMRQSV